MVTPPILQVMQLLGVSPEDHLQLRRLTRTWCWAAWLGFAMFLERRAAEVGLGPAFLVHYEPRCEDALRFILWLADPLSDKS